MYVCSVDTMLADMLADVLADVLADMLADIRKQKRSYLSKGYICRVTTMMHGWTYLTNV